MENVEFHQAGCKVLAAFGNNPHGEPIFRMVRANSRLQWSCGEFRPKYPKFGTSWIIEQWMGPEKYGAESDWESAKDENGISYLGPFPRHGDYEFTFPVWDLHDQPIADPGEHHLQVMAFIAHKNRGLTRSERWAHIQQAQEKAKEIKRKQLEAMIADAKPLLGGAAVRKHAEELEEIAKRRPLGPPMKSQPLGASLATGE